MLIANCAIALTLLRSATPVAAQDLASSPPASERVPTLTINRGELSALFRDNAESPAVLSGADSLFNRLHAPGFDAFDPDGKGSSAGLNFEHIISGHRDPSNMFTPRSGPYALYRLPDGRSAQLERRREDDPWSVSSTLKYSVCEPNAIDFEFRCTPHDQNRFGRRGYAVFFFANYMNDVEDVAIHFRGASRPGNAERWISGDAPKGHPDWNNGGTYRHVDAPALAYDDDHNFKLNLWSYDDPRYTKPFYYGVAAHGMCLILMFDRAYTPRDEIRLSLFKFKVPRHPRPAWDWQYVIHRVEQGASYGFRGRLIWKSFVSPEDCLAEYTKWSSSLKDDLLKTLSRSIRIGDTEIGVATTEKPGSHFLYVNLHDDENTGVEAGLNVLKQSGGRLVEFRHTGQRDIAFKVQGKDYRVDANRIFTPAGVRATLEKRSQYSEDAARVVGRFAEELLTVYRIDRADAVIALHNNTPGMYSALSYAANGVFAHDAEDVFIREGGDPDNFFFVTERLIFDALKRRGYSVVLQDNRRVTDDGSFSVYCGKANVRYINVEAEIGALKEQTRMILDLKSILDELGPRKPH